MSVAIWWIRRDLRLRDNQALHAARSRAQTVVPLFILDPVLWKSDQVGPKRLAFLLDGLRALAADLEACGSRLIIRSGEPLTVLRGLMGDAGADVIYAEIDHTPYARRRDEAIARELPLHLEAGRSILPPGAVLKDDDTPYVVFTPYRRRWSTHPQPTKDDLLPAPDALPSLPDLAGEPIPAKPGLPDTVPFPAGEAEAQQRLRRFVNAAIYSYDEQRDLMAIDGTSQLSPYLRLGMLSARQAAVTAHAAIAAAPDDDTRRNAETWLSELIWRDFYLSILHYFPHVHHRSFRPEYDRIAWDNDETAFEAWCRGQTGYPVVDAAMRQLSRSGWMHNRARMIVASFLVKDLLIDWRWGERWFMQELLDGDPAANNGGWQWAAGTGTDAAPYFRIFNPTTQGRKFDPEGAYIRRWVPELADVPAKFIHEPANMPMSLQKHLGCVIGRDYPSPIVDHKEARQRTLAAYKKAKETRS